MNNSIEIKMKYSDIKVNVGTTIKAIFPQISDIRVTVGPTIKAILLKSLISEFPLDLL